MTPPMKRGKEKARRAEAGEMPTGWGGGCGAGVILFDVGVILFCSRDEGGVSGRSFGWIKTVAMGIGSSSHLSMSFLLDRDGGEDRSPMIISPVHKAIVHVFD